MEKDAVLPYLAGMVDGDGYLKLTRNPAASSRSHPYYGMTIGVQQLEPSGAVRLFGMVFGGRVMPRYGIPGRRPIARCEVHTRKAEAAARRLVPYLLVKREQALLLLKVCRIREGTERRSAERHQQLAAVYDALLALHSGRSIAPSLQAFWAQPLQGYGQLGPSELGWSKTQLYAYLAGILDSDGNFRIEKRKVPGMLHPHYRINVRCAQVAPSPAVGLLADTFGGSLSLREDKRQNARTLAVWSIHDRSAVPAIKALLPYLVVKKLEAWLLLELRIRKERGKQGTTEWVHGNRWHTRVNMTKRCYTEGQVADFERIHREVQRLHSGNDIEPSIDAPCASAAPPFAL